MPKLGHYKLTELKPADLNSYFSPLTRDGARKDGKPGGYSKGTIAKAKNTLSSVLRTAVEWELIEKNPLERVHFEAAPTTETLKFWTPEQCTAFLEFIEQPYQVTTKGHSRTDDTGIPYEGGLYPDKGATGAVKSIHLPSAVLRSPQGGVVGAGMGRHRF